MRKLFLLIIPLLISIVAQSQEFDCSFLHVENFTLLGPQHSPYIPEEAPKKDINDKPWAMLRVGAVGFSEDILKELNIYSPSSRLIILDVSYSADEGCIMILLSSSVEGDLVFRYHGTSFNYSLPKPLLGMRVYHLDLALKKVNLTIIATPEDAKITIDNVVAESKGVASRILYAGNHTYSVECENYVPEINKVINLGKDEKVNVSLMPMFGYITINSEPQGADVYIEGTWCGTTPYVNKAIKRGRNNVQLKMSDYRSYAELVTVEAGETKELNIAMMSLSADYEFTNSSLIRNEILETTADTLFFGSETATDTMFVTTNDNEWSFDSVPDWCNALIKDNMFIVTCHKNNVRQPRSANIIIYTRNLTKRLHVQQETGLVVLKANSDRITFDPEGDTVAKKLETNVLNWNITTSDSWINAFESSDSLIVMCAKNNHPISRYGNVKINVEGQTTTIEIVQKSDASHAMTPPVDTVTHASSLRKISITTKPTWERIFIDGTYIGRSPKSVNVDDSVHLVRCGKEERGYIFSKRLDEISFKPGTRYITATATNATFGIRSGFIGVKEWGGYSHFQMNILNTDIVPNSGKNPFYALSMGPSFELTSWMSLYAGAGISMMTDSVKQKFDGEVEAGLMIYFRRIFISGGVQATKLFSGKAESSFSAGLGLYFSRYYDKEYGYCNDMSRIYWSLNLLYNHLDKTFGLMFSDMGKGKVRGYIKGFGSVPESSHVIMGLTAGCVLNMMGFIDMLVGGGYKASYNNKVFGGDGFEAELGVAMNVWRIPVTVMFRCNEVGKNTSYLSVDFGLGFSFDRK